MLSKVCLLSFLFGMLLVANADIGKTLKDNEIVPDVIDDSPENMLEVRMQF